MLVASRQSHVSLELWAAINRPPLERTDAVVALFEKARELAASFGYELGETQVGGGSTATLSRRWACRFSTASGSPAPGAHTLDEYIFVSDIAKRATLLTLLLQSI